MKKLLILTILCCLLLTACGSTPPESTEPSPIPSDTQAIASDPTETESEPTQTEPTDAAPQVLKFTLYTPNENADGFYATDIVIEELTAQNVILELQKEKVLSEDIEINSAVLEGSRLSLDFNAAFRDQLLTYGTAGERMMIGSVVNTFLCAYGAETVMITVDSEILESGHVVYDFPMEFFE